MKLNKKIIAITTAIAILPLSAFAGGGHDHDNNQKKGSQHGSSNQGNHNMMGGMMHKKGGMMMGNCMEASGMDENQCKTMHKKMMGSDKHNMGHMDGMDHSKMDMGDNPTLNKDTAIVLLEESIAMMSKTVSDKYVQEMFSDGPIMDAWHETTMDISDAVEVLENYAATVGKVRQDKIEDALEQFSTTLDDFHLETHERNIDGSRKQAQKASKMLEALKISLK